MRTVSTTKELPGSPELIWEVVTDYLHLGWRGDLASIRVSREGEEQIVTEVLRDGSVARFTVTCWQPPRQYRQTLTSPILTRSWGVTIAPGAQGKTRVTVREEYQFRSRLMLLASYPYLPIREGQKRYLRSLGERLKELQASPDQIQILKRDKEESCDAKQCSDAGQ